LYDTDSEPAPGAPTVALANAGAGNVDNGSHRYRITFVCGSSETHGGTVSDAVTVVDKTGNGKVRLTAISLGGSAVTARRIYRTAAGGTAYLLAGTISNNTDTTYTDNVADASLGVECPSANTTGDVQLTLYLYSAVEHAEAIMRRKLLTQTWDYWIDAFPETDYIDLPFGNLQSVTHVSYVDSSGDVTYLAAGTDYDVNTAGDGVGQIVLPYGASWPSFTPYPSHPVRIRFVCGWASADAIPPDIANAVKMIAADLYENRGERITGTIVTENKMAEMLLAKWRLWGDF
jgi:uncharacterized phiE125 gp8 family phage protein